VEIATLMRNKRDFTGRSGFWGQSYGKRCLWFQVSLGLKRYPASRLIPDIKLDELDPVGLRHGMKNFADAYLDSKWLTGLDLRGGRYNRGM
jgi:hypothetical protein